MYNGTVLSTSIDANDKNLIDTDIIIRVHVSANREYYHRSAEILQVSNHSININPHIINKFKSMAINQIPNYQDQLSLNINLNELYTKPSNIVPENGPIQDSTGSWTSGRNYTTNSPISSPNSPISSPNPPISSPNPAILSPNPTRPFTITNWFVDSSSQSIDNNNEEYSLKELSKGTTLVASPNSNDSFKYPNDAVKYPKDALKYSNVEESYRYSKQKEGKDLTHSTDEDLIDNLDHEAINQIIQDDLTDLTQKDEDLLKSVSRDLTNKSKSKINENSLLTYSNKVQQYNHKSTNNINTEQKEVAPSFYLQSPSSVNSHNNETSLSLSSSHNRQKGKTTNSNVDTSQKSINYQIQTDHSSVNDKVNQSTTYDTQSSTNGNQRSTNGNQRSTNGTQSSTNGTQSSTNGTQFPINNKIRDNNRSHFRLIGQSTFNKQTTPYLNKARNNFSTRPRSRGSKRRGSRGTTRNRGQNRGSKGQSRGYRRKISSSN